MEFDQLAGVHGLSCLRSWDKVDRLNIKIVLHIVFSTFFYYYFNYVSLFQNKKNRITIQSALIFPLLLLYFLYFRVSFRFTTFDFRFSIL